MAWRGVACATARRASAEKSALLAAFPDTCELLPWGTTHDVAAAWSGEASLPLAVPAFAVHRQLPADLKLPALAQRVRRRAKLFRVLGAVTRQFAATPMREPVWPAVSTDNPAQTLIGPLRHRCGGVQADEPRSVIQCREKRGLATPHGHLCAQVTAQHGKPPRRCLSSTPRLGVL